MFNKKDIEQIERHGLEVNTAKKQLHSFSSGFPHLKVVSPATSNNGITDCRIASDEKYSTAYEEYAETHKVVKFVPASGAASRMFKDLFEFAESGNQNKVSQEVVVNIDKFAFGEEAIRLAGEGASDKEIVKAVIDEGGLGYGSKPKALILFHKYPNEIRTALEEHLVEGALYAACRGVVHIHFTVSPEHAKGVEDLLKEIQSKYQKRFNVKYDISMSEQKSSTDTIAVNPDNTPFRNSDGSLLFRPGGHGALIENLNDIDADIVFIKNIDNVTTDSLRVDTVSFKKTLAGLLIGLQYKTFEYLGMAEKGLNDDFINEVGDFIQNDLCVKLPSDLHKESIESRWKVYMNILDRPVRVCGMVRNEGEPGGGPFWVADNRGILSLQIAEPNQIAPADSEILKSSTHFNPVDIVCGVKNYKGEKFDLRKYVDPSTGFIAEKSKDGKPLRALELPGLWNGAMSDWNTIFVEVPVSTFTPVKVVTDLLRPQHQEN